MENKRLFIQKLPLADQTSFVAKTFRTPHFEVSWHQHTEVELILFTESYGQCFAGNYAGEYTTGDIFIFGANLPHNFQKHGDQIASAVVVQFREDMWGSAFMDMPESKAIRQFLVTALRGLKLSPAGREAITPLLRSLENQKGFARILTLFQCLHYLAEHRCYTFLSTQEIKPLNAREQERIDRVFNYTFENFREPISINQVAGLVRMSVPAFCSYFKKRAHKTYLDFLIEVRISCASQLLADTGMPISEVCYASGFNTLSNFHRQFSKIKGSSPQQYRKALAGRQTAVIVS
ncbi:MAG: AraC family transcriptional regulator [Bacteroidota bacterium]